jgi:hypothetical protein
MPATAESPSVDDLVWVERCLGRTPRCAFDVAARDRHGRVAVIRNRAFLDDGTPMPTRYWLVDPDLTRRIARVESAGGVQRAEAELDAAVIADAHRRYAAERDATIPASAPGPRPSGGVGGTRVGVKCLHAHYAWFLAGGDDPVGRWVDDALGVDAIAATARSAGSTVGAGRPGEHRS